MNRFPWKPLAIGLLAGTVVMLATIWLLLHQTGSGGDARVAEGFLYPYHRLAQTRLHLSLSGPLPLYLALAQFPLYGLLLAWAWRRSRLWPAAAALVLLHLSVCLVAL